MKILRAIFISLCFILVHAVQAQEVNTDYQYALIEAVKQKNLGNLPGAIELYRMVLEENDQVAVAHYELGTLLALTGRGEKALEHLETAVEQDPENKWYFESYTDILVMQEEYKTAIAVIKDRIRNTQQDVDYLYRLANIYYVSGKSRKSINILEKIEKEYGYSDKITLLKANIYEAREKYKKALEEVENILGLFPESVEFHVVAAEIAMKRKDKELAADYYHKVFELDSLNIYALTNLTDYYREDKDFNKSFFYLNKSFQSNDIDYDKKMAILGFYLSDEYFFRNHSNELEELLVTMLEMYPEKRDVHLFATDFFIQGRKYEQALDALIPLLDGKQAKYAMWRQGILLANATNRDEELLSLASSAIEIFPDSAEIIYYKGIAEYEQGQYEELIVTFSKDNLERAGDPDLISQATMLLAESYYRLNQYEISDSLFRKIIMDEPDNVLVMNNFSYYLALRNVALDEAKELSWKTIQKEPENGTYLDTYAWVLYMRGEYEEAEKYILKALKFGGDGDPDVNLHAAEIHKALGNIPLARTFYQKALVLGGDQEEILKKLNVLNGHNE